jgi:pyrophosphatase PpaX
VEQQKPGRQRQPLTNINCVLFDLDGTLVDTVDLIYLSFDYAVKTILGKELSKEQLLENMGRPLLVQMQNFSRTKAEQLIEAYNSHNLSYHDKFIKAYPQTSQTLSWLKNTKNTKIGVVTSKKRQLSLRGLEITGLLDYIEVVVAMEDTTHHKPEPDPVHLALKELDRSAETTVFMGDSPFDLLAGRRAGTYTCAALWGPFSRAKLLEQDPDLVLENIGELKQWLA